MLCSECGAAVESKEESIQDKNGNQRTKGPVEEQDGSETRKVKQRSASILGAGFRLRERGIGNECGKVPVLFWRGEEFIDGKI